MGLIGLARCSRQTQRPTNCAGAARTHGVQWASRALVAVLIASCASAPTPTEITGVVQASATVNPSVSKRPSPLLVRVYELKSATAFNSADFVSLYQRDQTELGAEMVSREEFMLNPGTWMSGWLPGT